MDPLGYLVLFIIIGLPIIFIIQRGINQGKRDLLKDRNQKAQEAQWTEHPEERKYPSGKYLTGHPDIDTHIEQTEIQVTDKEVTIFSVIGEEKTEKEVAKIPMNKIKKVMVEDKSTMESRVTASRLLMVGIFAFALKKTEVHQHFYLVVEWADGNFEFTTIFEFFGNDQATKLCNTIIRQLRAQQTVE